VAHAHHLGCGPVFDNLFDGMHLAPALLSLSLWLFRLPSRKMGRTCALAVIVTHRARSLCKNSNKTLASGEHVCVAGPRCARLWQSPIIQSVLLTRDNDPYRYGSMYAHGSLGKVDSRIQ
jgi:hypothetical protein